MLSYSFLKHKLNPRTGNRAKPSKYLKKMKKFSIMTLMSMIRVQKFWSTSTHSHYVSSKQSNIQRNKSLMYEERFISKKQSTFTKGLSTRMKCKNHQNKRATNSKRRENQLKSNKRPLNSLTIQKTTQDEPIMICTNLYKNNSISNKFNYWQTDYGHQISLYKIE